MKAYLVSTLAVFVATAAHSQGSFIYDQQSSVEGNYLEGGAALGQQPLGQSFTPSLSAVGFIRIYLSEFGGPGGTLSIYLRQDSITGTILGTTTPVQLGSRFNGPVDFYFDSAVTVTPGTTYYFQPLIQSGSSFILYAGAYNYAGGTAFINGVALPPDFALWFREGIVVPEPGTWALLALGLGALAWRRRSGALPRELGFDKFRLQRPEHFPHEFRPSPD